MSFSSLNKQKTLTWVLIIISILNLFFFVSIYTKQDLNKVESKEYNHFPKRKIKKIRSRIEHDLRLDKKQVLKFKELQEIHQNKVSEIFRRKKTLKKESFKILTDERPDKDKLDTINKSLSNLQLNLETATTEHFLEIRNILRAEQLPYFSTFLKKMSRYDRQKRRFKKKRKN